MPDTKITALTAIGANPIIPSTFPIPMVDLTDTSMAASGTTKKVTVNQILGAGGTATLASATITGDLTVATSALKVTGGQVGIGTAAPSAKLTVLDTNGIPIRFGDITAAPASQTACYVGVSTSAFSGNGNGDLILVPRTSDVRDVVVYTGSGTAAERFRVSGTGIATWSNVGGVAGTAMTLNSTGLGVGVASPSAKLHVLNASLSGTTAGSNVIATLRSNGSGYDSFLQFSDSVSYNAGVGMLAGNLYFYTSGAERARIDTSGNLLVARTGAGLDNTSGVTLAQASIGMQTEGNAVQLIMNRTTSDGAIVGIRRNNLTVGDISVTTTGTTYNTISDYRLKESVQPLVGGLARISALKPSVYKWKSDGSNGEGFLAHELAEVVPLAVTGEKDAVNDDGSIKAQGVDLSKVVPILVAAIQELTAEVNALKNA